MEAQIMLSPLDQTKQTSPQLHLRLENFRSYESLEFTFPSGLTLIDGVNGVGKSNLLDSWFWCRYGWLPKWEGPKGGRADAVIRRGSEKTKVTATERIGRDEIIIERQRPHKLTVWKNGEKLKACSQDDLDRLLGMSAERCLICVYLAQKRKRTFYSMSDAERMELLSTVAGLEELDRALEKAKNLKTQRQNEATLIEGRVSLATEWLAEFPSKIAIALEKQEMAEVLFQQAGRKSQDTERTCLAAIEEHQKSRLESVKLVKDSAAEAIANIEAKMNPLMEEYQQIQQRFRESPEPPPELSMRVAEARDRLQKHVALIREQEKVANQNADLLKKIKNELDEMDRAKNGKCNSCSQPLPTWELQHISDRHLKKAQDYEGQLKPEIKVDPNFIHVFEFDVEQAEGFLAKARADLEALPKQLKAQSATILANYNTLRSQKENIESGLKQSVMIIDRKMENCILEIDAKMQTAKREYEQAYEASQRADQELSAIQKEQKTKENQLSELKVKLEETSDFLNEALDLIELFGPKGFRSICFDGLIQRISDRAGQLISILSDGVYSTYLEQVGADSKGNQKMVLLPVILRSGEKVYDDDLSGGFEDRVALAYDLAVSEAAGDGLPLLLDEVLKGLDAHGKVDAMSLLEEVAKTRPVLVIEHTTEMKAMFHQVIKITHENDQSRLVEGV